MILFRTLKIEITIRVHSTGSNVQQKAKFSQRQFLWKWERDCLNNFFCCNDHHRNQSHHHPHHWGKLYIYINLGKLNVRGFKLKLNGILTFPLFDDCITIILSSLHTTIKLNNNQSFVLQVINMGEVWIRPVLLRWLAMDQGRLIFARWRVKEISTGACFHGKGKRVKYHGFC